MPKGLTWSMLSSDDKLRLRGLSKEHAENIGLHILAAYQLEQTDPAAALEHAEWVSRQASRLDIARETLAFVAYRQGKYKLAEREFRTAYRMNGEKDYLPFIADCERGLGKPDEAIRIALSPECKDLTGETKFEMMLVFAGAYADKGDYAQALRVVRTLRKVRNLPGEYRMRAVQAEQNFLDEAGDEKESQALDREAQTLEDSFAIPDAQDDGSEVLQDTDMENLTSEDDDNLSALGFTFDQLAREEDEQASEDEEKAWREQQQAQADGSEGSEDSDGSDGSNDPDQTGDSATEEDSSDSAEIPVSDGETESADGSGEPAGSDADSSGADSPDTKDSNDSDSPEKDAE